MDETRTEHFVYVKLGVEGLEPIFNKVPVRIDDLKGEQPITVVRAMLREMAREKRQPESKMYFEIYINLDARAPFAASSNAPHFKRG